MAAQQPLGAIGLVVETLGGRVWVKSKPGEGTRFVVKIPAVVAGSSTPIKSDDDESLPQAAGYSA